MCTIKELKEFLDKFPQETIVEVLVENSYISDYYPIYEFKELDLSEYDGYHNYYDFKDNQFVKKDDPRKNNKYLELGES